jgi:hypothetical protein
MEFARIKCQEPSFDSTCILTEGDFDVQTIIVELLRGDRATTIIDRLQKEFPQHPRLVGDINDKTFVWGVLSHMLTFINLKDEFQRVYTRNDGNRIDFKYVVETLGMSFEGTPHRGIDDAINIQRAWVKFQELNQNLQVEWVKQIQVNFN